MSQLESESLSAGRLLAPAIRHLQYVGFDPSIELPRAGLPADLLADPDQLVPAAAKRTFLEQSMELTGDLDFGLHAGEFVRPGDYGLLELLVGKSDSADASNVVNDYHNLLGTDTGQPLELRDDHMVYRLMSADSVVGRTDIEYSLVCGLVLARLLLRRFDVLSEARFMHERPEDTHEHQRILAADLVFGAEENALMFPLQSLPQVSDAIDPEYAQWLTEEATRRLAKMRQGAETTGDRVGRVLQAASGSGYTESAVAYQLAVSQRTLRRRLADEGTSFAEIRDAARTTEAMRLLRDTDQPVVDVALHLGFSDTSGFHRAFKRLTGATPGAYRDEVGR